LHIRQQELWIGGEIAVALAAQGCRLVLHDRAEDGLNAVAARAGTGADAAVCVVSALTDLDETRRVVGKALAPTDGADIPTRIARRGRIIGRGVARAARARGIQRCL